jgi:hypothetical protein
MGISRRAADIAVAAFIFFIGVAVMADSYHLGVGWLKDSPASGYFPFRIGAIISMASAAIAIQAFLSKVEAEEPFVAWNRFRLVLAVLVPTAGYVLGIALLGIYVASIPFMAGFMRLAGRFNWFMSIGVSAACAIALFWLFEIQFLVPLPKGPLETWLGY